MKRSIAILALALLLGARSAEGASAPLILRSSGAANGVLIPAGTYRLDRARSRLTARISRPGQAPFRVSFERFDAVFVYDPARPEAARAEVTIDPASYRQSGVVRNAGTIAHWRAVSFVSNSFARGSATDGTLTGTVTFFGLARPMAIQLRLYGVTPGSRTVVGLAGSAAITVANPRLLAFTGLQLGGDFLFDIQARFVKD